MATINGKAAHLGEAAVFQGRYEALFELPAKLEAITADDLRAAATAVFRRNNATIGVLHAPLAEVVE
jgi:predicted Zn-dependent peptidase